MGLSVSSISYSDYVIHFGLLNPIRVRLSHSSAQIAWDKWENQYGPSLPHPDAPTPASSSSSIPSGSPLAVLFDLTVHSLASAVFDENIRTLRALAAESHSSDPDKRSAAAIRTLTRGGKGPSIDSRILQLQRRHKRIVDSAYDQLHQSKHYYSFLQALQLHSPSDLPQFDRYLEVCTRGGKFYSSGAFHWRVNHFSVSDREFQMLQSSLKLQAAHSDKFHQLAHDEDHKAAIDFSSPVRLRSSEIASRRDLLEHTMMAYELCLDEYKIQFYANYFQQQRKLQSQNEEKEKSGGSGSAPGSANSSPQQTKSGLRLFTSSTSTSASKYAASLTPAVVADVPNVLFLPLSELAAFLDILYLPNPAEVDTVAGHWKQLKHVGITEEQFLAAFESEIDSDAFHRMRPLLVYKFHATCRYFADLTDNKAPIGSKAVSTGIDSSALSIEKDPKLLELILSFGPGQLKIHEWRTRRFPSWSRQFMKKVAQSSMQSKSNPESPILSPRNSSPRSGDSSGPPPKSSSWLVNYAILWDQQLQESVCDSRIRRRSRDLIQTAISQPHEDAHNSPRHGELKRGGTQTGVLTASLKSDREHSSDSRLPYSYAKLLARFHIPCPRDHILTIRQLLETIVRMEPKEISAPMASEEKQCGDSSRPCSRPSSASSLYFNVFEFLEVLEQNPHSPVHVALSDQYSQQFAAADDKAKRQNIAFQQWKADEAAAIDGLLSIIK